MCHAFSHLWESSDAVLWNIYIFYWCSKAALDGPNECLYHPNLCYSTYHYHIIIASVLVFTAIDILAPWTRSYMAYVPGTVICVGRNRCSTNNCCMNARVWWVISHCYCLDCPALPSMGTLSSVPVSLLSPQVVWPHTFVIFHLTVKFDRLCAWNTTIFCP